MLVSVVAGGLVGDFALLEVRRQSKYCKPGLYYCVAKNTRGLVNKSLELEVYCKFSIFL